MKEPIPNNVINTHKNKHSWVPTNEDEEKEKFLSTRKTPKFVFDNSISLSKYFTVKKSGSIHFDLYHESKHILDKILSKFGTFDHYILASFGKRLGDEEVANRVKLYLDEKRLSETVSISYVRNIACSAKLNSMGYSRCLNKPEFRKYNLLINICKDNIFLRDDGIDCLLDHELGTHFIRTYNEGFQPWFWNRSRFGLSATNSYENKQIEEGLATINTLLSAKQKYLGTSAILYYATCMANFLSFGQLFDHLQRYIANPDHRWKHCVRIKRSLKNVDEVGGYAKDQCYFEGAVYLLANVNHIDYNLLCCGKVTVRDLNRIRRIARLNGLQTPSFMANPVKYKKELISIAKLNDISMIPSIPQTTQKQNGKSLKFPPMTNKIEKPNQIIKINTYLKTKKFSRDLTLSQMTDELRFPRI